MAQHTSPGYSAQNTNQYSSPQPAGSSTDDGQQPAYKSAPHMNNDTLPRRPHHRDDQLQPTFSKVIRPSPDSQDAHNWYGSMMVAIGSCMGTIGSIPGICCCPDPYQQVHQGQVGLVTRFGRFTHAVDPGLAKINPMSEKLIRVDVRTQIVEVPQQVCMTSDNVSIHITSVIYYCIIQPDHAIFRVSNVRQALIERTQTTLRQVIGESSLQDVIDRRENIATNIRNTIEIVAKEWGVDVESILIKDIVFSKDLQESLSMAAQSKRAGEAKIITAQAEVSSAKLMRQAADILSSDAAMQIRYLEAMQAMAKSSGSKVIFMPGSTNPADTRVLGKDGSGKAAVEGFDQRAANYAIMSSIP